MFVTNHIEESQSSRTETTTVAIHLWNCESDLSQHMWTIHHNQVLRRDIQVAILCTYLHGISKNPLAKEVRLSILFHYLLPSRHPQLHLFLPKEDFWQTNTNITRNIFFLSYYSLQHHLIIERLLLLSSASCLIKEKILQVLGSWYPSTRN